MKAWALQLVRRLEAPVATLIAVALVAGLLFANGTAHAESALSRGQGLAVCVARQQPGDTPAAMLASPQRFDCGRPQPDWGPGNYWVWLDFAPDRAGNNELYLSFMPQWQRSLAVYTRDAEGRMVGRWIDDAALSPLTRIGGHVAVPLDGHDQPVSQVLVQVDGALNAGGLLGDPQIGLQRALHAEELLAAAVFAAFAGLGIGLLCYNVVLWVTIRERFQLTYCLSLLAMLVYAWASSGAMALQFPWVSHTVRVQTGYVMLSFVGALALQFITDFIEPDKLPRLLRSVARNAGVVCLVAALGVVLAPHSGRYLADRLYVVAFLPVPPLVVAVTLIAWRRGSHAVRVLLVAWVVPLVVALLRIAHALHLVEYGVWVKYSMIGAMSVEALLSSLAMSLRIKLITNERDRAIADERAARHLASVDPLTGLLNRRALLEQVVTWESPEPLRLLIIDIDRFKAINDEHGHLVGDEVLRAVAEVLAIRSDLRGSVARLGGEEFAIIGTADELHEGIALAVLADVRARPMVGSVQVTVSVGMAEGMVRSEDEWRELYRRADAALYQAKSDGRNRAVHYAPAPQPPGQSGDAAPAVA